MRQYQVRRLEDVSPSTCNRELGYVRQAMRLAMKENRLTRLPHFPMLDEPERRDVTLENDGELVALLSALPDHHRGWVALAAYTGWRRRAVLSRKWSDITTDSDGTRWLNLDSQSSKNKQTYRFPVVGDIARIVDEQRQYVEQIERKAHSVIQWLFPYPDGRPIRCPDVAFKKAAKAAGCHDLHIHDLRRFAVSQMVELGISDDDVMALAGVQTRSILTRYDIVNERRKVEAAKRLTGALDAEPSKKVAGIR